MSKRNHEPMDLQDYLSGDSDLSKQYRTHSNEQSPEHLDRSILSAARATAQKKKKGHSPFSLNWMIPVSLAAVLVLAISIVPIMQEQFDRYPSDPGSTTSVVREKSIEVPSSPSVDSDSKVYKKDILEMEVPERLHPRSAPAPEPEIQSTQQKPKLALRKSLPTETETKQEDSVTTPDAEEKRQETLSEDKKSESPPAPMMEGFAGIMSSGLADQRPGPETWIEEIRKLIREDKMKEARASIEKFTQQYPEYPVKKALGEDYKLLFPE